MNRIHELEHITHMHGEICIQRPLTDASDVEVVWCCHWPDKVYDSKLSVECKPEDLTGFV